MANLKRNSRRLACLSASGNALYAGTNEEIDLIAVVRSLLRRVLHSSLMYSRIDVHRCI